MEASNKRFVIFQKPNPGQMLLLRVTKKLGGGFKQVFIFIPIFGEHFHVDEHILSDGWVETTNSET